MPGDEPRDAAPAEIIQTDRELLEMQDVANAAKKDPAKEEKAPAKEEKAPADAEIKEEKASGDAQLKSQEAKRQAEIEKIESQMKGEGMCGKNCGWITLSILAGFSMGTGAFIFASGYSEYKIFGTGLTGPGAFVYTTVLRLSMESTYRCRTGRWTKPTNSRVLKDDGSIKWFSLFPLFMNFATNGLYLCAMTFAWDFAKRGGINQGVISTLLSCASLINIVTFYFKFGETISKLHFIGVFLMLACIVCLSIEAASKGPKNPENESAEQIAEEENTVIYAFSAILLGFVSACLMSTKHMFIRLYKSGYSGIDMGIDSAICEFFLLSFFFIPLYFRDDYDFQWIDLAIGAAAGVLISSGRILISVSIAIGLAGPAQALMSTHALWQAVWSAIIGGQTLTLMQILALGFGLLGVFSMSYFDHLATKMKMQSKLKKLKSQESLPDAKA